MEQGPKSRISFSEMEPYEEYTVVEDCIINITSALWMDKGETLEIKSGDVMTKTNHEFTFNFRINGKDYAALDSELSKIQLMTLE